MISIVFVSAAILGFSPASAERIIGYPANQYTKTTYWGRDVPAYAVGSGFGAGYTGSLNQGFVNPIYSGGLSSGVYGQGQFSDQSLSSVGRLGETTIVRQTEPIVSKATHVFQVPEDKAEIQRDQTIVLPRPKQHYNVVFIKAPGTTVVNHPSTALGGQHKEKTLIYVVSDKKRIENRIEAPLQDQAHLQRPEVFFVKNNLPTEVINNNVKYQTVGAIQGAENGAVNGIPNQGYSGITFEESASATPAPAAIGIGAAQNIASSVANTGTNGVQTIVSTGSSLFNQGASVVSNGVNFGTGFLNMFLQAG